MPSLKFVIFRLKRFSFQISRTGYKLVHFVLILFIFQELLWQIVNNVDKEGSKWPLFARSPYLEAEVIISDQGSMLENFFRPEFANFYNTFDPGNLFQPMGVPLEWST
jgi:hypothetical protein